MQNRVLGVEFCERTRASLLRAALVREREKRCVYESEYRYESERVCDYTSMRRTDIDIERERERERARKSIRKRGNERGTK